MGVFASSLLSKVTFNKSIIAAVALLLVISMFSFSTVVKADGGWAESVDLSPSGSGGSNQNIAVSSDASSMYAVWSQSESGTMVIKLRTSFDQGATWNDPLTISSPASASDLPDLKTSVDGSKITVVWRERNPLTSVYQAATTTSINFGESWTPPELLGAIDSGEGPSIAGSISNDRLHIAWSESNIVKTAASYDYGRVWDETDRVVISTQSRSIAKDIKVVSGSDGVSSVVVWFQQEPSAPNPYKIYFTTLSDGVINPVVESIEGSNVKLNNSALDAVVSQDGNKLVAATQQLNGSMVVYISNNGGETWSEREFSSGRSPRIAVSDDGKNISVVWGDWLSEVKTVSSKDGGETWTDEVILQESGLSADVTASSNGQIITAVWRSNTSRDTEVQASVSKDGGQVWSSYSRISDEGIDNTAPIVASSSDGATVVSAWRVLFPGRRIQAAVLSNDVDTTPPTVEAVLSAQPNQNGWFNKPVTIDWQSTDQGEAPGAVTDPSDTNASIEGTNVYISEESCDNFNNCATGSITVSIDTQKPNISFDGYKEVFKSDETIAISCSFIEETSGIDSSECNGISAPASDYLAGGGTVTATATDMAGNLTNAQLSFSVESVEKTIEEVIYGAVESPFDKWLARQASYIESTRNPYLKRYRKIYFNYSLWVTERYQAVSREDSRVIYNLVRAL